MLPSMLDVSVISLTSKSLAMPMSQLTTHALIIRTGFGGGIVYYSFNEEPTQKIV